MPYFPTYPQVSLFGVTCDVHVQVLILKDVDNHGPTTTMVFPSLSSHETFTLTTNIPSMPPSDASELKYAIWSPEVIPCKTRCEHMQQRNRTYFQGSLFGISLLIHKSAWCECGL